MLVHDHLKYDDKVLENLNQEFIEAGSQADIKIRIGVIYLGR